MMSEQDGPETGRLSMQDALTVVAHPPVARSVGHAEREGGRSAAPVSEPVCRTALEAGSVFHGDFRIAEWPVKAGGMGAVYKAVNVINGAPVAIKLIRSDLSQDEEVRSRFLGEDDALRRLSHPAVVRYFGVRRNPDLDQLYIVMEFVSGPSLEEWIKVHGALPVGAVQDLCHRLAGGLHDAHAQGVIHRDLSPDNILLAGGDIRAAKIIDFGIAKVSSANEFTAHRQSFIGKFRYASPEHFSSTAKVDEKSDIYSLGLVLAAAALGRPLDMGRDELSGAAARQRRPDLSSVPPPLRSALAAMLDPKPDARPTAADLLRRRPRRRISWRLAAAAGLVVVGGAGASVLFDLMPPIGGFVPNFLTDATSWRHEPEVRPLATGRSIGGAGETERSIAQDVRSLSASCQPVEIISGADGRGILIGMVDSASLHDRIMAAAARLPAAVSDHVAVSPGVCRLLNSLRRLNWLDASKASLRPSLKADRQPAIFSGGEVAHLSVEVPVSSARHVYKVVVLSNGFVGVSYSLERSPKNEVLTTTVRELGWSMLLVISSAAPISSLEMLVSARPNLDDVAKAIDATGNSSSEKPAAQYQFIFGT